MSFSTVRLSVLILLGAVVLLFPADGLRALGLGEARVDSYLGQPLDVTIRLLEAESGAVDGMTVASASPSDFDRLGIPAEALALGLEVTMDRRVDPPTIRVRSRRPATDPIVQILVDARWASGRVLREYTLFLDPPTIDSPPPVRRAPVPEVGVEEAAPVDPEPTRPAPGERQPARAPDISPVADPEPSPRTGRSVEVARGDTLWSIAYSWRPDTGMSMDQVLMAIFEQNRHAFIDENINRLRSGVELTMPDPDAVRDVDHAEAQRRIRQHMQAWQQLAPVREVPEVSDAGVPEAAEIADRPVATTEESEIVHRLDVVPPEEDEFADGPVVSDSEIRRVQGAITAIEDEILAEQLESEAFDEQLADIREALETRDAAGLAVAEEELAELEARLREARLARAEAESDDVDAYFEALESELIDVDEVDEVVAGPVGDVTGDEPVAAEAPEEPVAAPDTAMPVTATGSGMAPWLWIALGTGLILVIAIAVWAWNRRRATAYEPASDAGGFAGAEQRARKAVASNPSSLAAHLALLKLLADRNDQQGFSDALDDMYQHADDEEDGYWQEALGLAMSHAPNHPLLTPNEMALDESDDVDRRADEVLSMLDDVSGVEAVEDAEMTADQRQTDELFDLDMDEDELTDDELVERPEARTNQELGEDLDLAELSDRLDDPASAPGSDKTLQGEGEAADFSEYDEADDRQAKLADTAPAETAESESEEDLDLEFEFTSSADPDDFDDGIDEPDVESEVPADLDEADFPGEPDRVEHDDELSLGETEFESTGAIESELDIDDDAEAQGQTAALTDEDADVKLDLARAYISVDLTDSARAILEEVISGASTAKQEEARELLDDL